MSAKQSRARGQHTLALWCTTALTTCLASIAVAAQTLPTGGIVTAGSAAISQSGSRMTIRQGSNRAAIAWQGFSIGANAAVAFEQPSAQAIALNRVVGNDPSRILGQMTANGRVFLVNPNGILFGQGARVDVGGLLATTANLSISDRDFVAGASLRFAFDRAGRPDAAVVNHGTITVREAGLAAFVAPGVQNSGTISARLGRVALASGNTFTLDLHGDQLVNIAVGDPVRSRARDADGNLLTAAVDQRGRIMADGGRVELSANVARGVVDAVINMSGVIEARSVEQRDGVIVLSGGDGAVDVSGRLDASGGPGQAGGRVAVRGDEVRVRAGASIDVSGDTRGGTVLVGGGYQGRGPERTARRTLVERGARIDASARSRGDGGTIVVWADDTTIFSGTVLARGGANGGNGGLVETSGKAVLNVLDGAVVDTSAPFGVTGTWLLDPRDINIAAAGAGTIPAGGTLAFSTTPSTDVTISATTLQNALATSNVLLQANRDINVQTSVTSTTANALTLEAGRDITFSANAVVALTGGNFTAIANSAGADATIRGTANADIVMNATSRVFTNGGNIAMRIDPAAAGRPIGTMTVSTLNAGSGAVALLTDNTITQNTTATGTGITSGSLVVRAGGATGVTLTNANNSVATVAANVGGGGQFSYANAGALTIGELAVPTGGTIAGITTTTGANNGNISVRAVTSNLTIDRAITAPTARRIALAAGGQIIQSAASTAITGGLMGLFAGDDVTLASANNNVTALAAQVPNGSLRYVDADSLAIDSITGIPAFMPATSLAGVTATTPGASVDITVGANTLTINRPIATDAATGAVALLAGTTITQAAAGQITAAQVAAIASQGVALNSIANNIGTIAGRVTANGSFSINNANALTVGEVILPGSGTLAGITIQSGTIQAQTDNGNLTLDQPITIAAPAATDRVVLNAGASIEQNTTGAITAPQLAVFAGGSATLDAPANDVNVLAARTAAANTSLRMTDADDLTVGPISMATLPTALINSVPTGTLNGITANTTSGTIALTSGGALTQTALITGNRLAIRSGGDVILENTSNQVARLAAQGNGALRYFDASSIEIDTVDGLAGISASAALIRSATGNFDITIRAGAPITAIAGGESIVIVPGRNFINQAGAGALNPGAGRFLVYLNNIPNNTPGGLAAGNFFGISYPTLPTAPGNRFVYRVQPTLTVTADNFTILYGAPAPGLTFDVTGFVAGDTLASVGLSGTLTTSYAPGSPVVVGGYPITQGTPFASGIGYLINFAPGTITVNPAPLTVTANDATRVEGQPNPPFTATFTGFRLGQGPGVLGGTLIFNTPATPASSPGTYAITPSGLTATNYVISFVDGVLTVTAAPLTPPTAGTPTGDTDGSVQAQRPPLSTPISFVADRFTANVSLGGGPAAPTAAALQQITPAAGPGTQPMDDTGPCGEAVGDSLANTWLDNFRPGAPSAIEASVAACRQSLGAQPQQ